MSIYRAKNNEERADRRHRKDLLIHALGDGSDYTAFQDFAGIPTLNLGFGGEDDGDQYHSIYDDFYWFTHFSDTDFVYGRALAQSAGSTIMRLADADVLPYDYEPQAAAIGDYESELEKILKSAQEDIAERNTEIQEGVFTAAADPKKTYVPPPVQTVPDYMNFAPMKNAITQLKEASEQYAKAWEKWKATGFRALPPESVRTLNADLMQISRMFLNDAGLPGRPWFKNQIYAPGAYTGYDARPIAAVREYMDEKKFAEANGQIPQVSEAILRATAGISKAAGDLDRAVSAR